jgi:hypothetical protein
MFSQRHYLDLTCAVLAVVSGLAIGWLDLHTTEVVVTIMALMTVGVLLGLFEPIAAWRWAVLVVIGLPLTAAVARLSDLQTAEPARVDVRIALVAFAFTMVGTYTGVFIRRAVQRRAERSD